MLLPSSKIVFAMLVFFFSLFSLTTPHWFFLWAGMELGHLCLLPFLAESPDSLVKYFWSQAAGSILFLGGLTSGMENLFLVGLFVKLGVFPFHFWVPLVVSNLAWLNNLFILTWQKMAPLLLLNFTSSPQFVGFSVSTALFGAWGGLTASTVRNIIAFSSITHTGWLLYSCMLSSWQTLFYFCVYTGISIGLLFSFHYMEEKSGFFSFNEMSTIVIISFLSLSGLPPLVGFLGKWSILMESVISPLSFFYLFLLLLSSIISLFYYIKIIYSMYINLESGSVRPSRVFWLPLMNIGGTFLFFFM